jgi:secreted PhoX family phosphatase
MFSKTRLFTAVASVLALSAVATVATAGTIKLDPVPFAETDAQKREIKGSDNADVNRKPNAIGFNTLLRSGDTLPLLGGAPGDTARYGQLIDHTGAPLLVGGVPQISNDNDFNSLIPVDDKLFLVSQFESRPAAVYLTELDQATDGKLTPVATRPVDFSGVGGGFVHCAGSVTPWSTHLGSEEYEPDARSWVDPAMVISDYNAQQARYFGGDGSPADAMANMNPYHYGWAWEVSVDSTDGDTTVTKHYAMGRIALELAYVMPDRKTVYLTDDGTNTMLALFVADKAGDLSAGTLYAAKWTQLPGNEAKGGKANLTWVNLGHATSAEIETYLGNGTKFDTLFDYEAVPSPDNGTCPTLQSENSGHAAPYHECLRVKPGMEKAASRLETRRYASLMGATTEFRKMEGITFNPEQRVLYLAMSEVNKGMLDSTTATEELGGGNHIRVPRNDCGAVYSLAVGGAVSDTQGGPIKSAYVARSMTGLIAGKPVTGDAKNTCDKNGLANPDNVTYLPRYKTLVIGEDTGSGHQNDVVWSMDLLSGKLTRILTTPYGSETTSPYWYSDIGGFGYLMTVAQHPYGESDQSMLTPGSGDERAYTGYVGPFPILK